MLEIIRKSYTDAIIDTDRDRAFDVINNSINSGIEPEEILFKVVVPSMDIMLNAIAQNGEFNLSQFFMASQIAGAVTEKLIPMFKIVPKNAGRVVIGTSFGDFHGLGKRIVAGCLKAHMIDVIDLGLSVAPEKFVSEAIETNADVIAISSMMVHTARGEKGCIGVRQILKDKGLEGRFKIIVGGAPYLFDSNLYEAVQADAWSHNGIEAAALVLSIIEGGYDK